MKVLRSWLKDYVDINLPNDELAEQLSLSGTLVEAVGAFIDEQVVVGEIKDIKRHPNADRLQVAVVYNGAEDLQIVCGAPNIEVGQKVPLAQIGSVLPEGEIRQAEIRGVESFGMMCSEVELGLGDDHSGIKILPAEWEAGKKISEYLNGDAIFELEITPNRGDCLSHLGVAREIAATLNAQLKTIPAEVKGETEQKIEVENPNLELCPQYYALPISGVRVAESPDWLKNRLKAVGQKPINNVVDVTNYILLDLGQPLHSFDAKKVEGKIVVRTASENEMIVTLDGTERKLNDDMLVISDTVKAIAIAGVMGGMNTQVDQETTDIILEAAEFEPVSVRKTAKTLKLSTEASYRFERGIDSGRVEEALRKAASIIKQIAGGKIGQISFSGQVPVKSRIEIEFEKINNLLDLELSHIEIEKILDRLGFEVSNNGATIPLWRHDVAISEDLVEEVGRIYGLNKIEDIAPEKSQKVKKSLYFAKEQLKDILVEVGFNEVYTYAFLS
jgi:phenylalanyl-tRNA synthetase beta chain